MNETSENMMIIPKATRRFSISIMPHQLTVVQPSDNAWNQNFKMTVEKLDLQVSPLQDSIGTKFQE